MDDLNVEGSGQQKPSSDHRNIQHNPRYANYWAPLTPKRRHKEHGPQRPSERIDPTQQVKGRTGDCPEPSKETATRRSIAQGRACESQRPAPLHSTSHHPSAPPNTRCPKPKCSQPDCSPIQGGK